MKLDEKLLVKIPKIKDSMRLLGFIKEDSESVPVWYERATNRIFKESEERHYIYIGKYIGHIPLNEGFIMPIVSFDKEIVARLSPYIDFSVEIPPNY